MANNNDPWRGSEAGPPDFDKVLLAFKRKLDGLFGRKPGFASSTGGNGFSGAFRIALIALVLFYVGSGIYIVKPPERAAVFQFGKFVKEAAGHIGYLQLFVLKPLSMSTKSIHHATATGC